MMPMILSRNPKRIHPRPRLIPPSTTTQLPRWLQQIPFRIRRAPPPAIHKTEPIQPWQTTIKSQTDRYEATESIIYNEFFIRTIQAVVEPKPTKPVNHLVEGDGIVQATNKLSISVNNGSSPRVSSSTGICVEKDRTPRLVFIQDLLRSGAIVQFLSKNSGCLLQVVMSPSGALVFDGNGAHNAFNSTIFVRSRIHSERLEGYATRDRLAN